MYVRRDVCDTQKYDDDSYTNTVDTTLVRYHTRLTVCTCYACFAKNMMMMYQQFPQIWYVSQVSVISVRWSVNSLSRMCSFALFSIAKLTDGSQSLSTKSLISPPVQNQYVIQGMGGRCSVSEDESLRGSR